jgi:transposase
MRFAMSAAIPLRDEFDGPALRALAKASKDANQTRRLLSLAVIYEGGSRSEAAALGGVGLQIIRDWVLRFNAEGPDGLIDKKPPGASPKLSDAQRRALCAMVESGPIPAIHGVVRWRLKDLQQWLWEEFRVSLDESTVSRELKALGFVKISARPRHRAQNEFVREDFKKASPPRWQRSGPGCRLAPR